MIILAKPVLNDNGRLNRAYLRELIFSEPEEKKWLENLLHPLIRHEMEEQLGRVSSPYCIIEIPLLKKKSDYPYIKSTLLIKCSKALQLTRLIKRDGLSIIEAKTIIKTQNKQF